MKKLLLLAITLILVSNLFAQKQQSISWQKIKALALVSSKGYKMLEVNCGVTPNTPPTCDNLIDNNNFNSIFPYNVPVGNGIGNPFNINLIPSWGASSGSANIYDLFNPNTTPPAQATGFAFMIYGSESDGNSVEGIAQKIPDLVQNQKYALSFFKLMQSVINYNAAIKFKIELLYCSDFANFPNPNLTNDEPVFPFGVSHQTIYCEINPTNPNWERNLISFTANANYNVIMITPSLTNFYTGPNTGGGGGIDFAYPELIKINNNFAGNPPATPTAGNCTVTIGPATPNCGVYGAVFTWLGPNGQTIPAPANQQIQVNTSIPANVGTWTLQMTVPNQVNTNNTCSTNGVQGSVVVPACIEPPVGVWPKAYISTDGITGMNSQCGALLKVFNNGVILNSVETFNYPPNWVNHIGALPNNNWTAFSSMNINILGQTNWFLRSDYPEFALSNGTIQVRNYTTTSSSFGNTYFINASTGIVTTNPMSTILNGEKIIAETNDGAIFTLYGSPLGSFLRIHKSNAIINSINVTALTNSSGFFDKCTFNKVSNNLFINSGKKVFHYNGSTLIAIATNLTTPTELGLNIATNDNSYFLDNGILKRFDWISGNVLSTNITDLVNQNLTVIYNNNFYQSDLCLVFNTVNSNFYLINFSNNTSKKISTTNYLSGTSGGSSFYEIDNDNLYIAGYNYYTFTIGNQTILGQPPFTAVPHFITKFNIQTDFTLRAATTNENPVSRNSGSLQEFSPTLSSSNIAKPNAEKQILDMNQSKITNITSIQLYNQVGQLLTVATTQKVINELMNNRFSISNVGVQGIYFLKITYKNNSTETIKRFLN